MDPLAFTSIILNMVVLRILTDNGLVSPLDIRERVDQAMLLWERTQFVKEDAGRAVHANLELILSVVEGKQQPD